LHPVCGQGFGVQEGDGEGEADTDLLGDALAVGDDEAALVAVVVAGATGTTRVAAIDSRVYVDGLTGCDRTETPDDGSEDCAAAGPVTQVAASPERLCASELPTTVTTISRAATATAAGSATARSGREVGSGSPSSPGAAHSPMCKVTVSSSPVDM
jgi:hypothetical protein